MLHNKNIVISGASSGIGQQCAIDCSKNRANIILIGRNEERLNETYNLLDTRNKNIICPLNLTDYAKVATTIPSLISKIGRIDGIINCAGISTTLPFKLCTPEKVLEIFQSNFLSGYNLTRELCSVKNFSKEGGSVIFISSIMSHVGEKGKSIYAMSKGALLSVAKSLACEMASRKIRVNTISPGCIITPINERLPHIANPDKRMLLEQKHLLGLGETTDISNLCVFLLSDRSRWITGTDIVVDGGYLAQ